MVNTYFNKNYLAFSGGIEPLNIHKCAIEVLKEIGIDITDKISKNLEDFEDMEFDTVIGVCEDGICPNFFKAKNHITKPFKDPKTSNKRDQLWFFRKTRDDIKKWIFEAVENEEF
jgi:arsenate reductase